MSRAATQLASLFDDGGAAFLAETGLGSTWAHALTGVPPGVLAIADPMALLTGLRDHWSRNRALRPAIAATRALLRLRIQAGGHAHPDTLLELGALGALAQRAGKVDEGLRMLQEAWQGLRSLAGGRDLRVAVVAANLALHHVREGQWREAEGLLEIALRIRLDMAPETTGQLAAQLAEVRIKLGKHADAIPLARQAWLRQRDQLGPHHPNTLARARTLGGLLLKVDRPRLAVEPLREAHHGLKSQGNLEDAATVAMDLGLTLHQLGHKEEGWRLVEEAVRWSRDHSTGPRPHPTLPGRLTAQATLMLGRGRAASAEALMLEALEAERILFGDDSVEVATRYAAMGTHCASAGRNGEAVGWLDPAASLLRSAVGDRDPRTRLVVEKLATLLVAQAEGAIARRDREMAQQILERAWEVSAPVLGFSSRLVLKVRELAGRVGLSL